MDTEEDFECVGQYGTIKFIRKDTFDLITSYPVDSETTTFGRDPKCNVRLYFQDVDPHHCTLEFDDGKAYLHVTSPRGVMVDGAFIPGGHTACLNNHSRFQIYLKLFEFEHPPKELRARLISTPRARSHKSLRMSMIPSAFILTPSRPSSTLDMRVLQSPVRPFRETPDEVVTFVESDHVAVVEDAPSSPADFSFSGVAAETEDSSLVALEEVEVTEEPMLGPAAMARQSALNAASGLRGTPNGGASPRHHRRSSSVHIPGPSSPLQLRSPARVQPPPQTPRPRRKNPSLHKAVLVRSAHRAYVASIAPPQEEEEDETEHLEPHQELLGDEDIDEDGEGDIEEAEPQQLAPVEEATPPASSTTLSALSSPSSIFQASMDILGSILPSFTRSSQSPPPAPQTPETELDNEDPLNEDSDEDEVPSVEGVVTVPTITVGESSERPPTLRTPPKPSDKRELRWSTPQNHVERGSQRADLMKTVGPAPKRTQITHTHEDGSEGGDVGVKGLELTPRSKARVSFSGPVARPFGPALDLDKPSVIGKPTRPLRRMTLDVPGSPQPTVADEPLEDEDARRAAELRAQERQSKLAAIDAAPRSLADPSSRRTSTINPFLASPAKSSAKGILPTPERRQYSAFQPLVPLPAPVFSPHVPAAGDDSDSEDDGTSEDMSEVEPAPSFDELRRNIQMMKTDRIARETRLSVGGPRLNLGPGPLPIIMSQDTFVSEDSIEEADITENALIDLDSGGESRDAMDVDQTGSIQNGRLGSIFDTSKEHVASLPQLSLQSSLQSSLPSSEAVQSPSLVGVRDLFKTNNPQTAQTPVFAGIRDLFKTQPAQAIATPSFEGVDQMFPEDEEVDEAVVTETLADVSMESDQVETVDIPPPSKTIVPPKRAPSAQGKLKEKTSDIPPRPPSAASNTAARGTRTRTGTTNQDEISSVPPPKVAVHSSATSRSQAATSSTSAGSGRLRKPTSAVEDTGSSAKVTTSSKSKATQRTQLPTAPTVKPRTSEDSTTATSAPSSKKKPASAKPSSTTNSIEEVSEKPEESTATRLSRRTRANTATPSEDGESAPERPVTRSRTPASKSPTKKSTGSVEEDEEEDAPPKAASRRAAATISEPAEKSKLAAPKATSSKRARATTEDESSTQSPPTTKAKHSVTAETSSSRNKRGAQPTILEGGEDANDGEHARKRRKPSPEEPKEVTTTVRKTALPRGISTTKRATSATTSSSKRLPSARTTASASADKENTPDEVEPAQPVATSSKPVRKTAIPASKMATSKLPAKEIESAAPATRSLRTRPKK